VKLYYQSLDDATVTYSGTADTGYPVTNVQDRNANTLLKETTGIGLVVNYITIDFGSAVACDSLVLGNVLGQANFEYLLEADDNSGFATPETILSSKSLATSGDYIESFTSKTYRYWRIGFLDTITTSSLSIGTVFLGTAIELSRNPNLDETEDFEYSSQVTEALGGGRFGFGDHDNLRQKWNYNFDYITETDKTNMKAMAAGVYGSRRPFYFTDPAGTTHFARMMDNLTITQIGYQAYTMSLALEQEM